MMTDIQRKRKPILPSVAAAVYKRGHWLCHWCKRPVILPQAMKLLEGELRQSGWTAPMALFHNNWTRDAAPLLDELGATLDHVIAHNRDGAHTLENFVTACAKCNVRKSDGELATWLQRDKRKPVKGKYGEPTAWDGLSGLFVVLASRVQGNLTMNDRAWLKALTENPSEPVAETVLASTAFRINGTH